MNRAAKQTMRENRNQNDERIIMDLLLFARCAELHHSAKWRHGLFEDCPLEKRIRSIVNRGFRVVFDDPKLESVEESD